MPSLKGKLKESKFLPVYKSQFLETHIPDIDRSLIIKTQTCIWYDTVKGNASEIIMTGKFFLQKHQFAKNLYQDDENGWKYPERYWKPSC